LFPAFTAAHAFAAEYPANPLRIITLFPAAGATTNPHIAGGKWRVVFKKQSIKME
jgi:hypothetical protein